MKKAFTMIELLVVMVVGAILSAVAVSKIHTSELRDTARSIANDIRYTQILAMSDDLYANPKLGVGGYNDFYYRIEFVKKINKREEFDEYSIYLLPHIPEYAKDYLDANKEIKPGSLPRTTITETFGVNISKFEASIPSIKNIIIFNELGEPLNYDQKHSSFKIELDKRGEKACIYVEQYSGFVRIDEHSACK